MIASVRTLTSAFGRLPAAVRVEIVIVLIVAGGAGVLSWDALRWGAGQLGIEPSLDWIYPVVVDGTILSATVGLAALTRRRDRAYMWTLLMCGLGASVLGNGAHASGGPELVGPITLHRLGSAVPALGVAATLHTLLMVVRQPRLRTAQPSLQGRASRDARPARGPRRRSLRVLHDGREVSAAHARRLRARERSLQGVVGDA